MTGVKQERNVGAVSRVDKLMQSGVESGFVEIPTFDDAKPNVPKRVCDISLVIGWILETWRMNVLAVANDQRHSRASMARERREQKRCYRKEYCGATKKHNSPSLRSAKHFLPATKPKVQAG
jgi:hypothetical protein